MNTAIARDLPHPKASLVAPVFVVGAERSGSTLLRLMLDHHPALSFPHQLEFLVDWADDPSALPNARQFARYLAQDPVFRRSGFAYPRPDASYREAIDGMLAEARGRAQVGGGTVHRHFERLHALWPKAKFVHLVRDPRAVALSCIAMGWAGNAWAGVQRWLETEMAWDRLCQRLPEHQRMEMQYEGLVSDPEGELRRVCEFLGVRYDARMLSYPQDSTYGAPSAKGIDRWRKVLRGRELALVEQRLGDLLVRRGYAPAAEAPTTPPSAVTRAVLKVEDRLRRARQRQQRYGWRLWGQALLANRLGPWAARVAEAQEQVDNQHIL